MACTCPSCLVAAELAEVRAALAAARREVVRLELALEAENKMREALEDVIREAVRVERGKE